MNRGTEYHSHPGFAKPVRAPAVPGERADDRGRHYRSPGFHGESSCSRVCSLEFAGPAASAFREDTQSIAGPESLHGGTVSFTVHLPPLNRKSAKATKNQGQDGVVKQLGLGHEPQWPGTPCAKSQRVKGASMIGNHYDSTYGRHVFPTSDFETVEQVKVDLQEPFRNCVEQASAPPTTCIIAATTSVGLIAVQSITTAPGATARGDTRRVLSIMSRWAISS